MLLKHNSKKNIEKTNFLGAILPQTLTSCTAASKSAEY